MGERGLWLVTFPWQDDAPARLAQAGDVRVFRSLDGLLGRAYINADKAPTSLPAEARVVKLRRTLDVAGASAGSDAPFHYVVSTDVLPEWAGEMNAWYDTEHLPGLAAVPGTVRAQRHEVEDLKESPRYHASYDLATHAAFNSEPWLAVRATEWSSRVRPAFRNTERVMFERVKAPV
ncbi:hypothetical protein BH09PSE5_BH09PSE5_47650 [soil metagenome]